MDSDLSVDKMNSNVLACFMKRNFKRKKLIHVKDVIHDLF